MENEKEDLNKCLINLARNFSAAENKKVEVDLTNTSNSPVTNVEITDLTDNPNPHEPLEEVVIDKVLDEPSDCVKIGNKVVVDLTGADLSGNDDNQSKKIAGDDFLNKYFNDESKPVDGWEKIGSAV